jgi:Flp pilus assembly protein TadD
MSTQTETFGKDQIDAIAVLGFQLYEQGKTRDAETMFTGLIAIDDTNYLGYAGMGALALAEEKLEEAVDYLRKAAERNPTDPTVHANLGEALLRQAKFEEAAAEFTKALDLDPEEVDPGANRARAILDGMGILVEELSRIQATVQ